MPPERISRFRHSVGSGQTPPGWWGEYLRRFSESFAPPRTQEILTEDCSYLVEKGVFGAGQPGDSGWPRERIRKGIVMGAVQSGKTASMLGVAALSIDKGVDVVVILAGTTKSLWNQTYERLVDQLDIDDSNIQLREASRVLIPPPNLMNPDSSVRLSQQYFANRPTIRNCLKTGKPIIAVVMKNNFHLQALSKLFKESIFPEIKNLDRNVHFLILDDESDDGSILDETIENNLSNVIQPLKQLPRSIVDLWESRPHSGFSEETNLFVTYIGYTATPQANFLQANYNPLAPTDFAVCLRTPFDEGRIYPRSSTFLEPSGLTNFYIGGEVFYKKLEGDPLCKTTSNNLEMDIRDAVRGFLVAGAIRLWRETERLSYSQSIKQHFETRVDANTNFARVHSMLVHPSARVLDHFEFAAIVMASFGKLELHQCREMISTGVRNLPIDDVIEDLEINREEWIKWLTDYRLSAEKSKEAFNLPASASIPDESQWEEIKNLIENEVVPNTKLSIINSDPEADDRPTFSSWQNESGEWVCPNELSTIFISGSVMSRGLTLEGLTTTLFLRMANEPLADTQIQMQRWFGYRGREVELCRLITTSEQLNLFRSYHNDDSALRNEIIEEMNRDEQCAPAVQVLQGRDYRATGKITPIVNWPLAPGARPFYRMVNEHLEEDPNIDLVKGLFRNPSESEDVSASQNPIVRGRILKSPLNLLDVADLLDKLTYEEYWPSTDSKMGARWLSLEDQIGLNQQGRSNDLTPLFRPPSRIPKSQASDEVAPPCPFSTAAYLRLWHACLSREAMGVFPTDNPRIPWSMVDLEIKTQQAPKFWVGIRNGSGELIPGFPFEIRTSKRELVDGRRTSTWGTQNPDATLDMYRGDTYFDFYHHQLREASPAVASQWRPPGAPGQLLFYVVENPVNGSKTLTFGMVIPLGGPDQIVALVDRES